MFSISFSASSAILYLAVKSETAGLFVAGYIDCEGVEAEGTKLPLDVIGSCAEPRLNVEELERVGEGTTGPSSLRRELRPISGSEASKLIAM